MIRGAWLPAVAVLVACGSRAASADPQTCAPTTGTLAAGASAASLEGEYRVRLVATSGPRAKSSVDGTLDLSRPAPGAAAESSRRVPVLVGSGHLRLEDVGGPAQDLGSAEPMRPGVFGFDLPPLPNTEGPRVLLRLGASANRQDAVRVEGAYTALRVREIREDGFTGEWTSGAPLPLAEGYFCAWRDSSRAE